MPVQTAEALLHQLYRETLGRDVIEPDFVHLFLQQAGLDDLIAQNNDERNKDRTVPVVVMSDADRSAESGSDTSVSSSELVIRTPKKSIKPRGANQLGYCRAVRNNDINFGIGPAVPVKRTWRLVWWKRWSPSRFLAFCWLGQR